MIKTASAAEIGGGISTYAAVETTDVKASYLNIGNPGKSKDSKGNYWLIRITNLNSFKVRI